MDQRGLGTLILELGLFFALRGLGTRLDNTYIHLAVLAHIRICSAAARSTVRGGGGERNGTNERAFSPFRRASSRAIAIGVWTAMTE